MNAFTTVTVIAIVVFSPLRLAADSCSGQSRLNEQATSILKSMDELRLVIHDKSPRVYDWGLRETAFFLFRKAGVALLRPDSAGLDSTAVLQIDMNAEPIFGTYASQPLSPFGPVFRYSAGGKLSLRVRLTARHVVIVDTSLQEIISQDTIKVSYGGGIGPPFGRPSAVISPTFPKVLQPAVSGFFIGVVLKVVALKWGPEYLLTYLTPGPFYFWDPAFGGFYFWDPALDVLSKAKQCPILFESLMRLLAEPDDSTRDDALFVLHRLYGKDFEDDVEQWRQWWTTDNGKDTLR